MATSRRSITAVACLLALLSTAASAAQSTFSCSSVALKAADVVRAACDGWVIVSTKIFSTAEQVPQYEHFRPLRHQRLY
jgi:hypothetical protein